MPEPTLPSLPLDLPPAALWRHFATLCRLPRPSRHEGQVMDHLCRWASTRSLNWTQDAAGNLLIRKPASPGMAERDEDALPAASRANHCFASCAAPVAPERTEVFKETGMSGF